MEWCGRLLAYYSDTSVNSQFLRIYKVFSLIIFQSTCFAFISKIFSSDLSHSVKIIQAQLVHFAFDLYDLINAIEFLPFATAVEELLFATAVE